MKHLGGIISWFGIALAFSAAPHDLSDWRLYAIVGGAFLSGAGALVYEFALCRDEIRKAAITQPITVTRKDDKAVVEFGK